MNSGNGVLGKWTDSHSLLFQINTIIGMKSQQLKYEKQYELPVFYGTERIIHSYPKASLALIYLYINHKSLYITLPPTLCKTEVLLVVLNLTAGILGLVCVGWKEILAFCLKGEKM